jgi:hypothetical protein
MVVPRKNNFSHLMQYKRICLGLEGTVLFPKCYFTLITVSILIFGVFVLRFLPDRQTFCAQNYIT